MAPPPHSVEQERALIGACLIDPDRIGIIAQILAPTDLYSPDHQQILAAIYAEHDAGHRVDATVIAAALRGVTAPNRVLGDCIASCGSITAAPTLAVKIADHAALRRVQALALEAIDLIDADHSTDPAHIIDHIGTSLAGIDLASDTRTIEGLWSAEEMMSETFAEPDPVVPGFLSREDRLMIVGVEGSGKSVWARMVAAQVAVGVHPFMPTSRKIPPQTTLIVDVENPERVIRAGLRMLPHQPPNLHILARPGGLNLRSRRDRALLHRVCERVQPRLMVIGPLYKMTQNQPGETEEQAALALQAVLDEVRIRFGCALIIEHHAPHGSDMFRNLRPVGSSAWLRWPEFGWKMVPYDEKAQMPHETGTSLLVGTFRGDRVKIDRPQHFYRSNMGWPWMPYWPEGPPRYEAET